MRGNKERGEFAIMPYMECSLPRDSLNKLVGCVSLPWSTDNDTDHSLAETSCISGEDSFKAEEWFGVGPFCSIKGTIA